MPSLQGLGQMRKHRGPDSGRGHLLITRLRHRRAQGLVDVGQQGDPFPQPLAHLPIPGGHADVPGDDGHVPLTPRKAIRLVTEQTKMHGGGGVTVRFTRPGSMHFTTVSMGTQSSSPSFNDRSPTRSSPCRLSTRYTVLICKGGDGMTQRRSQPVCKGENDDRRCLRYTPIPVRKVNKLGPVRRNWGLRARLGAGGFFNPRPAHTRGGGP